jgi:hypothetical protein
VLARAQNHVHQRVDREIRCFLIDHIGYPRTANTKNLGSLCLLEALRIHPARNLGHEHLLECPLLIDGLVSLRQQLCRLARRKSKIGKDIAIRWGAVGDDFLSSLF